MIFTYSQTPVKSAVLKIIVKKLKIIVDKLDLYIISVYICRNKNEITMKKQEMIDVMIAEEKQLWKEMQECIDRLGMHDSITDMQIARWATVKNLIEKLQIK